MDYETEKESSQKISFNSTYHRLPAISHICGKAQGELLADGIFVKPALDVLFIFHIQ